MNLGRKKLRIYHAVAKHYLGYSTEQYVSLFTIMARLLRKHGYKDHCLSEKEFVLFHDDKIVELHEKMKVKVANKPKIREVKKKQKAQEYKVSNEFLQSYEWRQKRFEALNKYGRRCMCCGATPETGAIMNVDHIKPRKTHPELALDIDNLQILCHECNHGKGNKYETDFRNLENAF